MKRIISYLLTLTLLVSLCVGAGLSARGDEAADWQAALLGLRRIMDEYETDLLLSYVQSDEWQSARAALERLLDKDDITLEDIRALDDYSALNLYGVRAYDAAPGDFNRDGLIDSTDARLVLQYEVGLIAVEGGGVYTYNDVERADVSGFAYGDLATDSTDARLILQYEVGLIRYFPVEGGDIAPSDRLYSLLYALRDSLSEEESPDWAVYRRFMFGDEVYDAYLTARDALRAALPPNLSEAITTWGDTTALFTADEMKPLEAVLGDWLTLYAQGFKFDGGEWRRTWKVLEKEFGYTKRAYPVRWKQREMTPLAQLQLDRLLEALHWEQQVARYGQALAQDHLDAMDGLIAALEADAALEALLDVSWDELLRQDPVLLRALVEAFTPYLTVSARMGEVDQAQWDTFWDAMVSVIGGAKPPKPPAEVEPPQLIPV